MHRAPIGDIDLEYEIRGTGEPVVLVHAGVCACFFTPLMDEPALRGHRLIRYHRAGYAGSGHVDGALSLREQAAQCRLLMRHLDIARAHIVGHSSGANIALQLALDHPDAVRSLALLEPALLAVPTGPFAAEAMRRYRAGDMAAADRAATDADTFFGQELPAVREWIFGADDAGRIRTPTLVVLGACSDDVSPAFRLRHELLLDWLPAAESFILAGANHLLHVQNPTGMAEGLARFFTRHAP